MTWLKRFNKAANVKGQRSGNAHQQERRDEQTTAAAIDRLTDQIEAAIAEEKVEDTDGAYREKVTIGLIFLTFVAALGGDVIFYSTMRDARTAAKNQHIDTQAALSEDDRAWIAPEALTMIKPIDAKPNFIVSLSFDDVGKEPALSVQDFIQANILAKTGNASKLPLDDRFLSPEPSVLMAYCNKNVSPAVVSVTYPGDTTTKSINATPSTPYDFPDVLDYNGFAVVNGCFKYVTFNIVHYSIFCRFLVPDHDLPPTQWTWRNCPKGNYAN